MLSSGYYGHFIHQVLLSFLGQIGCALLAFGTLIIYIPVHLKKLSLKFPRKKIPLKKVTQNSQKTIKKVSAKTGGFKLFQFAVNKEKQNETLTSKQIEISEKLCAAFRDFGIQGKVSDIEPGPVVTVYAFSPKSGVKISKITGLTEDIALSLKVDSVLMQAIPGKKAIGVQVPNVDRDKVFLGDICSTGDFKNSSSPLTLALGLSLSGDPVFSDLRTMPHLLIAGATGAGKSVALNCFICSLLNKSKPSEVKFILVDPKMLELSMYENIAHLLMPVITDPSKASAALKWAVYEMERRYALLQSKKCDI